MKTIKNAIEITGKERNILTYILSNVKDAMKLQEQTGAFGKRVYYDEYALDLNLNQEEYDMLTSMIAYLEQETNP